MADNKPVTKMTVTELRKGILLLTSQVNEQYKNANKTVAIETSMKKLKAIAGGKPKKGAFIAVNTRGKVKSELIRQYRELQYIQNLGIDTTIGEDFLESKFKDSYNKIIQNPLLEGLTQEEYRQVVEAFGSVGDRIVQEFGSTEIFRAVKGAGKDVNVTKLMVDTMAEKPATQADAMDIFINKLREELN